MITNDKTLRAIQALEQSNRGLFNGDIDQYIIEVLKSQEGTHSASDMHFLSKEVDHALCSMEGYDKSATQTEVKELIETWMLEE